jgi:HAE1 family hydrophobic/amphiphilic exporter-1
VVRRAAEEKERRNPLQRGYLPVIGFATRRRWLTVALGLVVLIGTFAPSAQLKTNFLADSGQRTLSISQQMPVGSRLSTTDGAARKVEAVLARTAGVETYQVTAGGSGAPWDGGGNTTARFNVTLAANTDAPKLKEALRANLSRLTGAGVISFGGGGGPGGGSADQLKVVVQAADPAVLARATEQARQAMADTPNVADVSTSLVDSAPRIDVTVNRPAAARAGFSEAAVGQIVGQVFQGSPLGQLTIGGRQQDVVLRSGQGPATVDALRALPVGPVKLADIATVTEVKGPVEITRIDGNRSITVSGTATGANLGQTTVNLKQRLGNIHVAGATITVGGVSADQANAFADLRLAVLAAVAIVFLIMVATFRSLVQPLILLVSIPFAATGAIGLLLATGTPLGVPALIGMLMLVGIVVTNVIVLMDLVNQYRAQGMRAREAVIEGGRRRLRPILMTAIATIFALLPMAFGLTGEGGFISQPLAVVVIGGLISSTLLTLVLVPTLYVMVEQMRERFMRGRTAAAGADLSASNGASASASATAASTAAPSAALFEGTDQFEVLRLPRSRRSP